MRVFKSTKKPQEDDELHTIKSRELPVAEAAIAGVDLENPDIDGYKNSTNKSSEEHGAEKSLWNETAEVVTVYPDGGWEAWGVVLACFTYASTQMGYNVCYGVFASALAEDYYPDTPLSVINLTSGLCNAFMMGVSFLFGRFGEHFGYKRLIFLGVILSYIAMVVTAFVFKYSVGLLLVFQGVILGVTFGIGQALYMSLPSMWFLKRRGLATGIAVAGSGFGGAAGVLIVRALLPRLGYQNTLITYGSICLFVNLATYPLLRVRNPYMQVQDGKLVPSVEMAKVLPNWLPHGVWRDSAFYAFGLSYFISLFGYLCPFLYLTPYTVSKNPSFDPHSLKTAMPLFLTSIGLGLGRALAGQLTDLFGPVNMLFLTYLIGGILQVVMWPLCTTYSQINAFGFLYGFLGCNFLSLLPVAAAQMFGVRGLATLTGFITLWCVPGQLAGGTIGGVVLSGSNFDYRAVAYYAGGLSLGGAVFVGYARLKKERRLLAVY